MMRNPSSGDETDQKIDKDILVKMKEFELVGQQLFGINNKASSPSKQSPSTLMRPSSIAKSNFFVSPEQQQAAAENRNGASALPFDTFGGKEKRDNVLKKDGTRSTNQSHSPTKSDAEPKFRQVKKVPSPFLTNYRKREKPEKIQESNSYTSRMVIKGVSPPRNHQREVRPS